VPFGVNFWNGFDMKRTSFLNYSSRFIIYTVVCVCGFWLYDVDGGAIVLDRRRLPRRLRCPMTFKSTFIYVSIICIQWKPAVILHLHIRQLTALRYVRIICRSIFVHCSYNIGAQVSLCACSPLMMLCNKINMH
jgi:hypothetical protein